MTKQVLRIKPPPAPPPVPDPPTPSTIHLAIVVPSLKEYRKIRDHCYALAAVPVKLHILIADPTQDELGHFCRFALVNLGLVAPAEARLVYPTTIELGWPDET